MAKIMFLTLVFVASVWYLAKITGGACREAREEISKLRKVTNEALNHKIELKL